MRKIFITTVFGLRASTRRYLEFSHECLRDFSAHANAANMSVRPTMYAIAYFNVQFLGYDVSAQGLKSSESLVSKIINSPRPDTKKQLPSF